MKENYESVLKANIEFHNLHAREYDRNIMGGHFKRAEKIFEKYKGDRFLDFGCGTGKQLKVAKKYFDEIYGIDCSSRMLDIAKKETPNVVLGDIANTSYQSNYFDFINCFSVLHHLYEVNPVIEEAYRLLKPNGIFYTDNDPNQSFYKLFGWWLKIRRFFTGGYKDELKKIAEYHQKNGIDPEYLKKQFIRIGFKKAEINYSYPEKPDLFTKILIFLNKFLKSNSFYYYFSIIAQK